MKASNAPTIPATMPISADSTASCWTSRWRLAPSAARTAIIRRAGVELTQHQRRDVRARDEQNDSDCCERCEQTRLHVADEELAYRCNRRIPGLVELRIGVLESVPQQPSKRLQRTVHVLDRLAVLDAADEGIPPRAVLRVHLRSGPYLRGGTRKPEARSHHADDRARDAAETEGLANDVPVGAKTLPQRIAQNRDGFRAHEVFAGAERTSEVCWYAQYVEELRGHGRARHQAHGVARTLQGQVLRPVCRHRLEARELRPQPQELLFLPGAREPENADLCFARGREWIEQESPHHGEDCGRTAGGECQGQDCQPRIGGTADQPPPGVTSIHDPALEHRSSRTQAVCRRFEARHSSPPAPSQQRGDRAKSLPPHPPACRPHPLGREAVLVLRPQVGEHLVALGDGRQRAEDDGGEPGEAALASNQLTRLVILHDSTL
jgi:hypothetical protein